ncbi:LysM peptidoglycan-binding domain-containing protein [Salidesulfovibrio brasiliensis]|uniref:LysM peptidoglycan-binding domain-containing protein n=1 Tax=Salidesulfovibrio brasiliensis TaxID=221711 RepID=UPI001FDF7163|nr:LysM peptidoglycan-binding domain-containing protein [Salidesulfovibrio brasiliensis]
MRRGDTLWSIARRFRVSLSTLQSANGINNSRMIKPGMRLDIPDGSASAAKKAKKGADKVRAKLVKYRVRRGDNLYTIARRFGVTVSELRQWNSLNRKGTIYPNQHLKVYVR